MFHQTAATINHTGVSYRCPFVLYYRSGWHPGEDMRARFETGFSDLRFCSLLADFMRTCVCSRTRFEHFGRYIYCLPCGLVYYTLLCCLSVIWVLICRWSHNNEVDQLIGRLTTMELYSYFLGGLVLDLNVVCSGIPFNHVCFVTFVILAAWHLGTDMMLFLGTGFGFGHNGRAAQTGIGGRVSTWLLGGD